MTKIKINKLPAGFKLVNGKIEEETKMKYGGNVTGDQFDYGLVTSPQNYYNGVNSDENVRYSLSSVPRDKANIEAEGGETVLTDLTNDGAFGLYNITGPRHSKGGVPMFLPEQSFIYSDTDKMKVTKEEMAKYGIESKNKMTPAKLSKRFGLNEYYASMNNEFADDIQIRSVEMMLNKNMHKLSELAFLQESKKKFEDGVPLAAHPYLVRQGIDPIEFTAQIEKTTKKEAQMKAFAALPPEKQEQLMQLQEMMAQADQQVQQQPQQQLFQDPSMQQDAMAMEYPNEEETQLGKYGTELPQAMFGMKGLKYANPFMTNRDEKLQNDLSEMTSMAKIFAGGMAYGGATHKMPESAFEARFGRELKKYEDGAEPAEWESFYPDGTEESQVEEIPLTPEERKEQTNPLPKDHKDYKKMQEFIDSGNYKVTKGAIVDGVQQYSVQEIVTEENAQKNQTFKKNKEENLNKKILTPEVVGKGSVPIYNPYTEGSKQALDLSKVGYFQAGNLSGGTRPKQQGKTGNVYGSDAIETQEAEADFYERWGDIIDQIPGFDYSKLDAKTQPQDVDENGELLFDENGKPVMNTQWEQFQRLAEKTSRQEWIDSFGNDKDYKPYFTDKGSGSGFDNQFGLHTFNAPRFRLNPEKELNQTNFGVDIPPPPPPPPPKIPPPVIKDPPRSVPWRQDQNNLIALSQIDDELYLPWRPDLENAKMDYVLDNWQGIANSNNATASTLASALGAAGGPQAIANSDIAGKTFEANAKAINKINTNNVGIMNQVASLQPQFDARINEANLRNKVGVYDDTQKVLQNHDNFLNWKIGQNAELQNRLLTNQADTFNFNRTLDNFAIDPQSGGQGYLINPRGLEEVGLNSYDDRLRQFYASAAEYEKNVGSPMTAEMLNSTFPGMMPTEEQQQQLRYQKEMQTRGFDPYSNHYSNPYLNPDTEEKPQGKKGKEIKRMIVPFYTGKMGL